MNEEPDFIIKQLIDFNINQQIESRIKLCREKPDTHVCRKVRINDYDRWFRYYTKKNNKHVFSKGIERLESWRRILQDEPEIYFNEPFVPNEDEISRHSLLINTIVEMKRNNPSCYFFIMASLIIIFQIFGDGNHRTANEFYKITTGEDGLSPMQLDKIKSVFKYHSYENISQDPVKALLDIVDTLKHICQSGIEGGVRRKIKTHKRKNRRILKNLKKTNKRRGRK